MPRDVNNNFKQEKNKEVNAPIYLFEIQYSDTGWLYYTDWTEDITFDGQTYLAFPLRLNSISESGDSSINKVTVTVSNVNRRISAYLESYNGLVGRDVIIKMVWLDKLSDSNCYIEDKFTIDEVTVTEEVVNFVLAPKLDVFQIELPRRKYFRSYCMWRFKSDECGYSGNETECNKTFQRCKELGNEERFGGFPSIPKRRIRIT